MKFLDCSSDYLQLKMEQYIQVAVQIKVVMNRCKMKDEEEGFVLAKEMILNNEKLPFHICLLNVFKGYLKDIGKWISMFITFILGILTCMADNSVELIKTFAFWRGVFAVFIIGFAIEVAIKCTCEETEKLNIFILKRMSYKQFSYILRQYKEQIKEFTQTIEKNDTKEELAGVNPSELEFMSAKERERVLREAGLDPKQYDF